MIPSDAQPLQPSQPSPPSRRELGARDLAGYRVLRSLARDEHAEVLLGHRSVASADSSETVAQTVALKVVPTSGPGWTAALRECAALERARGEHVVDLLDLDADEESIRLLFERLPRGDLSDLLRIRPRLDAGEAVTLLAPIAVTLLRLHAAGVAHGNISARTVLFRDDGSPALIGFSRAELFEPGVPEVVLELVEAVRLDRRAARALASTVLGRVTGGRARAARELRDDLESCDGERVLPLLASRLFDVAAAVAVRFAEDELEVDESAPSARAVPVGALEGVSSGPEGAASPRIVGALGRVVPEALVQGVLDSVQRSPVWPVVAGVARVVGHRWASWTPGRRRIVLAVGAAAITVGVITAVIPAGGAATARTAPAATPPGGASASAAEIATPGADAGNQAIEGDDPLSASGALLDARERCLSSLSVPCLDRVDEAGSAALRGDQAAIRAAQQGGELPSPLASATDYSTPVLIERLGDSALVRLGEASSGASLLLIKGADGWRIRDLIAAAATTAAPSSAPQRGAGG
jgi:hypothetical protein